MSGLKKGPLALLAHIMLDLRPGVLPVRQWKYPIPWEAHVGIQTHLHWLKDVGILID
jgi:hypothetical protein